MKIISLTKEEIPLAGKIIQEEFNKPPYNDTWNKISVEKMLAHAIKIGKGFVLKEKGETIGVLTFREDYSPKGLALVIDNIAIKNNLQGKGYGKLLINHLEKYSKTQKVKMVYLYTSKDSKALGFYKKLGFKAGEVYSLGKKIN